MNKETMYLHALTTIYKHTHEEEQDQETLEEANETIETFESRHTEHDIEWIREALDSLVIDTANGNYDEPEIRLYDYDGFVNDYVMEELACRGDKFKEGFEFVFDRLDSDEQRRFIFWTYIRYADNLFANNSGDYEGHKSRCLFWIVEIYS
jgi:hypothetical protein